MMITAGNYYTVMSLDFPHKKHSSAPLSVSFIIILSRQIFHLNFEYLIYF